jgi:Fic family protein
MSSLPRRDRQGCSYWSYIPDPLIGRPLFLEAREAADVADAERAISQLDRDARALADTEALARLLLRAESVSSSKIEGLEIGARRLLQADAARAQGSDVKDVTAAEILANVDAMNFAIRAVGPGQPITLGLLLNVHRRLMKPAGFGAAAGKVRDKQNWIGGSSYNPCSASFVPPPAGMLANLLEDLCAYCSTDSAPAVVQAAVAHAQFEAIHPFPDGNGRVGRTLIHMVLRRRRLTTAITPPISLVLATMAKEYVEGLNSMCYVGEPTSKKAVEGFNFWMGAFASACTRAVLDAGAFERRILELQRRWRERIGAVRSDSTVLRLILALPGLPILTASEVQTRLKCSLPAALSAIGRLESANILKPTKDRQRRQVYEAREVIAIFTALERQLASA